MNVNAVFEGGGVKAIGLVGAIKAAEDYGLVFDGLAGTSSGAIVASLLAAGYTADDMKIMIDESPFESFLQKTILHHMSIIGTTIRILVKKGLYSGDLLEAWIKEKLLAKGIRTFADLPKNKLRIIASDISRERLLVLPQDIAQYGLDPNRLEVARAIRMSTSIPYFFEPVILRNTEAQKLPVYIVDGALLSNFPLWIFDKAYAASLKRKIVPTLGFQLVGRNRDVSKGIHGPFSMFQALFSTMMEAHDERYIEKQNRFRTIKIPTLGVQTTHFSLSKELSNQLFESGKSAGNSFLNEWSYVHYIKNYNQYCL